MKVSAIGSNKTQVSLADGTEVLFSYSTPVAALVPGKGWIRTEQFYSTTTSKHINRWFAENKSTAAEVASVPQWDLDQLVAF